MGAPIGTPFGVLLSGALLGAVCVAVATLLVASAAGRQQVGAEVTSGPVRPVVDPMLPADALGRSGTTLPGADQDKETRPRSAA
ncbi:MAG TPA: hypothetical protein VJ787_02345 [Thermoleophilia bacterium]|nr:hypothetical protein [Thermoleophilia bacterium]